MRTENRLCRHRSGNILVLTAIMMVPLCGVIAFSLDLGYIYLKQAELQSGADAAARAAASKMLDSTAAADAAALQFASLNCRNAGLVLQTNDIEYGDWSSKTKSFTPAAMNPNAVKVTLRRNQSTGNPVSLFFARVLGHESVDLTAEAIALPPPSGTQFQFLIDDEMIDNDEAAIEDLAHGLGVTSEDVILDLDGDGFIDLPAGAILELPTGQVGDEALFDISSYSEAFPFQQDSAYTTVDFIAEGTALESSLATERLQDVTWKRSNAPHDDLVGAKLLDPTPGVDPVDSHSDIMALPDPQRVYVSPVFDDDVSMAETDVSKYGSPAANLQGERRGLLAYRILAARPNPAGGSYLPLLTIEIVDPRGVDIESLSISSPSSGSTGRAVSLVQ